MGKLIDALYYLVVTAIIGGFVVQGALKLTPTLEHTFGTAAARVPDSWAFPLAIIGLLTLNLLLERILPLRALSEAHWVYTARPARRMPGFDGLSWVQLGLVGGVAALVGVGQGMWWQYAVIAVLSRFMMGMRNWTLAQLLAAGVTRSVGLGGLSVQDSELVSQAFAQCAITNNLKVWLAVRGRKPVAAGGAQIWAPVLSSPAGGHYCVPVVEHGAHLAAGGGGGVPPGLVDPGGGGGPVHPVWDVGIAGNCAGAVGCGGRACPGCGHDSVGHLAGGKPGGPGGNRGDGGVCGGCAVPAAGRHQRGGC